jgi:hypothetical protein
MRAQKPQIAAALPQKRQKSEDDEEWSADGAGSDSDDEDDDEGDAEPEIPELRDGQVSVSTTVPPAHVHNHSSNQVPGVLNAQGHHQNLGHVNNSNEHHAQAGQNMVNNVNMPVMPDQTMVNNINMPVLPGQNMAMPGQNMVNNSMNLPMNMNHTANQVTMAPHLQLPGGQMAYSPGVAPMHFGAPLGTIQGNIGGQAAYAVPGAVPGMATHQNIAPQAAVGAQVAGVPEAQQAADAAQKERPL